MIDRDGYRPNVGIILTNAEDQVFWARRCRCDGWQFPQGGIQRKESAEEALFRELYEEVGLESGQVEIRGRTRGWLRYDLPRAYQRPSGPRRFRGQKQVWFLLRFTGREADVRLDRSASPEFDAWRWVEYWSPIDAIVAFKRKVYESALTELAPLLKR
ncbi:RNA pyrophosphohydrolase [Acidiferrobacter sp. SPIII_3]|jgi:putative (di)nucleoside polyphosphate hydrolase|uniref:RNA pyrophosphohydrolase n=1 Tax=Acidiferrobacter sp. SPIII_3 TaxID=1281578 RepID=UPI000D728F9B|nr:RNA pyrophosphohydrolase [Acidiferrobacter sp. SPIII_3]AWP23260.1 RNA pyrophosphohydrolase [Acidiferrobacter sp. SPIII_3]